jgi:hypothetical protein
LAMIAASEGLPEGARAQLDTLINSASCLFVTPFIDTIKRGAVVDEATLRAGTLLIGDFRNTEGQNSGLCDQRMVVGNDVLHAVNKSLPDSLKLRKAIVEEHQARHASLSHDEIMEHVGSWKPESAVCHEGRHYIRPTGFEKSSVRLLSMGTAMIETCTSRHGHIAMS